MFTAGGFDTDIETKISAIGIFGGKVFKVYDPAILRNLRNRLNPPICGIIYEGITSQNVSGDMGVSSYLSVSLIVLAGSKARDARQDINKTTIATILDKTRQAILRTMSPANTPWEFALEIPFELGDQDLGYYQRWRTQVSV